MTGSDPSCPYGQYPAKQKDSSSFSPIWCTLPWSARPLGRPTRKDCLGHSSSSKCSTGRWVKGFIPKMPVLMEVGEDAHRPLWKQRAHLLGSICQGVSGGGARTLGSLSPISHCVLGQRCSALRKGTSGRCLPWDRKQLHGGEGVSWLGQVAR